MLSDHSGMWLAVTPPGWCSFRNFHTPHCRQVAAIKGSRHAASELRPCGRAAIFSGKGHEAAGPVAIPALHGVQLGLARLSFDAPAWQGADQTQTVSCIELRSKRTVYRP